MTDSARPIIGVAGMTHLGIVTSSVIAERGFQTICYDPDAERIACLASGNSPVVEPELTDLLRTNGARQNFTVERSDLASCDVVYIAQDVGTDDAGQSDLAPVQALIEAVKSALQQPAILVVLCQVPPGFTRNIAGVDPRRLYYQVETLVFGRAVQRAREPERYILGCADPAAAIPPALSAVLAVGNCPILPMRYESAELAKISINCCLVASVSIANTLAELCEAIGADWSEIVPSLMLDARIGPKSYLTPGLGIAGGNLERDLATVVSLAERAGTNSDVVRAYLDNSSHRRSWAAHLIGAELLAEYPNARIAVWGLAYKENTHSVKNSPSVATLAAHPSGRFVVHDPVVRAADLPLSNLMQVEEPLAALHGADALMILTPWPVYRQIAPQVVADLLSGRLVLDPYRVLDTSAARRSGLDHRVLGAGGLPRC